ncbi:hypothetical protein Q3G72_028856 [Acer saccharum]|nr:hypothetical protein Q3G72_028856 [Acer saccharum]
MYTREEARKTHDYKQVFFPINVPEQLCKQLSVLLSSLPFVTNQSKSRPQGWLLRLRETIGCQLRGVVAFLALPPGISLRSVVTVVVIVASNPRDFEQLASKKAATEIVISEISN